MFEPYLTRWNLTIDGDSFATPGGHFLPVRRHGVPAMLKLASAPEELAGHCLMAWWQGRGAAPVLAHEGAALLMVRAQGTASLTELARQGWDEEATRILCATISHLHQPHPEPRPSAVVPLTQWFDALWAGAPALGRFWGHCARTARELLATPREVTVLHGDIHHGNVLDFGPLGWLAIDPKGLYGERAFDYANLFCNPDGARALVRDHFNRRVEWGVEASGIERRRLLQWILAWTGLSTAWMLEDGEGRSEGLESRLDVGKLAAAALGIVD